jgi:hypothetical protein
VLGDWLDDPVIADEGTIEAPVVHPHYKKRRKIERILQERDNFQAPTVDGNVRCILCKYGPSGGDGSQNTGYLGEFDEIYKTNLGHAETVEIFTEMATFWNTYIATPTEDLRLENIEMIPSVDPSQILHHYSVCKSDIPLILLNQIHDIVLFQESLRDNGSYITDVKDGGVAMDPSDSDSDDAAEDEASNLDDAHRNEPWPSRTSRKRKQKDKPAPVVNRLCAKQWIEFNKCLLNTIKTYNDCKHGSRKEMRNTSSGPRNGTKRKQMIDAYQPNTSSFRDY